MTSLMKLVTALAVIAAFTLSPTIAVRARAPAADDTVIEEILVTVRKRSEAIIDVPAAINVFTAYTVEMAGIERPQDYISLVPNVTLVETQNIGTSFIVMRGLTQARNSEPSVALLIDGVPQVNPSQFNQEMFDIE